tara:strand:+ start:626877 stop:627065 length:189 start_codon:yes stop_codon:yes gene_type:complete
MFQVMIVPLLPLETSKQPTIAPLWGDIALALGEPGFRGPTKSKGTRHMAAGQLVLSIPMAAA